MTMHHVDTYFKVPTGRLKLREISDQESILIFYERDDEKGSKASNYFISPIQDPEALKDVLSRSLGVKVIVDKHRKLYMLKNTRIHVDMVSELGNFMELETVIRSQTREEAMDEHLKVIELLGIRNDDLVEKSYSDLLLAKKKNSD